MIIEFATPEIVNAATTTVQAGVFDWVNEKGNQALATMQILAIVAGVVVGIVIAAAGRNIVSVLIGIAVGAFIAGLPAIIQGFSGNVEDEFSASGSQVSYERVIDAQGNELA